MNELTLNKLVPFLSPPPYESKLTENELYVFTEKQLLAREYKVDSNLSQRLNRLVTSLNLSCIAVKSTDPIHTYHQCYFFQPDGSLLQIRVNARLKNSRFLAGYSWIVRQDDEVKFYGIQKLPPRVSLLLLTVKNMFLSCLVEEPAYRLLHVTGEVILDID